ncbi:MAG: hypothetical protein MI746_06750 [Pseudomonadales bacterium]|nr:hypothetical protein [Pseudomonadales bacterium]
MAGKQPSVEDLFDRFDKEVDKLFYEILLVKVIEKLGQPSIAEIRLEVAKFAAGKYVRSEASDKQVIGRMDKTFGLLDCVGGSGIERRFRLNVKGELLLSRCQQEVIEPMMELLATGS